MPMAVTNAHSLLPPAGTKQKQVNAKNLKFRKTIK